MAKIEIEIRDTLNEALDELEKKGNMGRSGSLVREAVIELQALFPVLEASRRVIRFAHLEGHEEAVTRLRKAFLQIGERRF